MSEDHYVLVIDECKDVERMVIAVVKVNLKDLQLELGGAIVASSGCNIRGNSFVITHTSSIVAIIVIIW